jgi:pimeloyl-CoA synthetase
MQVSTNERKIQMFTGAKVGFVAPRELAHLVTSNYHEALREEVPIKLEQALSVQARLDNEAHYIVSGELCYVEEFLGYVEESMVEYIRLMNLMRPAIQQ